MASRRTYHHLISIPTFQERFEYLKCKGRVGDRTFGAERYLNQMLYRSGRWKSLRNEVIIRDEGCDLAMPGYEIQHRIFVHHMNPITLEQVEDEDPDVFNPEFLICTSFDTHQAIHYGDASLLPQTPIERRPWDTCPWR